MAANFFLGLVFFLLGILLMEIGILSVLVSIAYSDLKGSVIPAITGTLLILLGSFSVVRAKRRFLRKDENKESPLY
jgi:energy-converting hydrogenase Eha subunit C